MKRIFLVFIVSFIYSFFSMQAQIDLDAFENYNIYDGLPSPSISSIVQDGQGFLWFGTYDGLSRFDGNSFVNFRSVQGDSNSLPENEVTMLFIDSRNILWVGTARGLATYNPVMNEFKKQSFILDFPGHRNTRYITDIKETRNGDLWISTTYGLYRYFQATGKSIHYLPDTNDPFSLPDTLIHRSYLDSEGRYWLCFWHKGLYQLSVSGNTIQCKPFVLRNLPLGFSEPLTMPTAMSEDDEGNIWVGIYQSGVLKFDPVTGKVLTSFSHQPGNSRSISDNRIKSIFWEDKNKVWIGFDEKELNLLDPVRRTALHITPEYKSMRSVKANFTRYIYKDNAGSLWFGTRFNGVNKLSDKVNLFMHVLNIENDSMSLPENDVRSFCQYDSILWVGMNKGYLSAFNLTLNAIIKNFHFPELHSIRDIEVANDNKIWLATYGKGLVCFNPATKRIDYFNNDQIKGFPVYSLLMVENGLWFRSHEHLNFLNFQTKKILSIDINESQIISQNRPTQVNFSLISSDNGYIWTNTNSEIISLNPADYVKTVYNIDLSSNNSIRINCMALGANLIWVGTNQGLYEMNLSSNKITRHLQSAGYLFNDIQGVVPDKYRNLWITTINGIVMYDTKAKSSTTYTSRLFINNTYFNPSAVCYTTTGIVIAGGSNGFNTFKPEKIDLQKNSARMVITSIKINNAEYSHPEVRNASFVSKLQLKHYQNNLTIDLALLNFNFTDFTNYAYRMDGFDKDWIYSGNKRSVSYINLPPGRYTFRAKANSYEGVWSNEVSLFIRVAQPYWRTWWFFIIILALIISALYFAFKFRVRTIEQMNEKLKHLVQERTVEILAQKEELRKLNVSKDKLFSIIGHDLKNPFNAISGFSRLLIENFDTYSKDKQIEILKIMQNSTDNIIELLDNILEWSRANTDRIKFKPMPCDVNVLCEKAFEHLKYAAENKTIKLINQDISVIAFADVDMITTALRNIISNGIKFTMPGGSVTVSYLIKETSVVVKISDTGIGIRPEVLRKLFHVDKHFSTEGTMGETGTGIGLILAKEFIERNNGSISVESTVGQGTTFFVELPVRT